MYFILFLVITIYFLNRIMIPFTKLVLISFIRYRNEKYLVFFVFFFSFFIVEIYLLFLNNIKSS